MFKKQTAFILGAGASAEFNMPVGMALTTQIAETIRTHTADPRFWALLRECAGHAHAAQLQAVGNRISQLIPRFNSMDEALHFLSDDADAVELGKAAIAYQILKAERNSLLSGIMLNNPDAIEQADNTWASHFLKIALSATRRQDFKDIFRNVTVIDFNYDRILPQYLYLSLQRLYGLTGAEASQALNGLTILHPYGSLGLLDWETDGDSLPFLTEHANLTTIAGRIRTYTEERNDPEINRIKKTIEVARTIVVLGFGFHNQNIDILQSSAHPGHTAAFATVYGIGGHNHQAVAQRLRSALSTIDLPQCLAEQARGLMRELAMSISLAVS